MEGLRNYDAVNGLKEKDYFEIFELEGHTKKDAKELSIVAKKMKGVFWSKKFETVLSGNFKAQNVLTKDEFIKRMKSTKTVQL